jgi:hypothetical protein
MVRKLTDPTLSEARSNHGRTVKKYGVDSKESIESQKVLTTLQNKIYQARRRTRFTEAGKQKLEVYLHADQQSYIEPLSSLVLLGKSTLVKKMIDFAMENEELFFDFLNKDLPRDKRLNVQLGIDSSQ